MSATTPRPWWFRLARAVVLGALGVELLYVLAANAVLKSGLIDWAASRQPDRFEMRIGRAVTWWPARVHVENFHLRLQDDLIQMELDVGTAQVDVRLLELVRKRFSGTSVRTTGTRFKILPKVEPGEAQSPRVAAFPTIDGYARPALVEAPSPPGDPKDTWSVELDDVVAGITELWVLEYRYQGPATASGQFALEPGRTLSVGPAALTIEGGALTAGPHEVATTFTLAGELTIHPVDLPTHPGFEVFEAFTGRASARFELASLGLAALYVEGARAQGTGTAAFDVAVTRGMVTPESRVAVALPTLDLATPAFDYLGSASASLEVQGDRLHAEMASQGELSKGPLRFAVSGLGADAFFKTRRLASRFPFENLHATLAELRVVDTKPLLGSLGLDLPALAKTALGNGPLVASATAHLTPEYRLVRLTRAQLGSAELRGAALAGAKGWNGAFAGTVAKLPFGVRLLDGQPSAHPLIPEGWLPKALTEAGIQPERKPPEPAASAP